jgi:protein arginine N-methyltransferase 5
MYGQEESRDKTGDQLAFARNQTTAGKPKADNDIDLFETWDAWNLIRNVCKYNSRLSVGKKPYTAIHFIFHILQT